MNRFSESINPADVENHNTTILVKNAILEINEKRELAILEKFNFLIEQGVLVIVETQPVFTRVSENKIKIDMAVDVQVKDQERLEELVKENEELRNRISEMGAV